MNLYRRLQRDYESAIIRRCRKGQCTLKVSGYSRSDLVIIDLDKYTGIVPYTGKICDYLIFLSTGHRSISVVEMKAKTFHANDVIEQLANGAREADRLIASDQVMYCHPILLSKAKHANELKILRQRRISFRGKPYPILVHRCGDKLADIVKLYSGE